MTTTKFSRQRESIKNYLATTKEHPTADMVYDNIRKVYPNISLGTVYRNLNFLVEQGSIIKISYGDGSDRFDGNVLPHYHFVCKECSAVEDITLPEGATEYLLKSATENFDGTIDASSTYFFGVCGKCLKNSKE
ncbi:Fur family transcriptional regulator [Anaerocolumna chitinilytica]|uniref:Transcriptional repressor n=1 Tax=Anaerocolumna chitinilytica TaxID=1727145 RepID=A0A7I8DLP6_9FIRM|nr:transcriptional repressor [Anaerocolumna chitinilytica]BCJ97196.1 transcriptional repressor [Anaerocolumna chitinilytica]